MENEENKRLESDRKWRQANPEKVRGYSRRYYESNKEKKAEYAKKRREEKKVSDRAYYLKYKRKYRQDALEKLGGKCVVCGFSDWRGLQIDHVHGGGCQHRKKFSSQWSYYKDILENHDSGDFQVLCANCNQIKRYEAELEQEHESP